MLAMIINKYFIELLKYQKTEIDKKELPILTLIAKEQNIRKYKMSHFYGWFRKQAAFYFAN